MYCASTIAFIVAYSLSNVCIFIIVINFVKRERLHSRSILLLYMYVCNKSVFTLFI